MKNFLLITIMAYSMSLFSCGEAVKDAIEDQADGGPTADPVGNWKKISEDGAPSARMKAEAVLMGEKIAVIGGSVADSLGGIYDPSSDSWEALPEIESIQKSKAYDRINFTLWIDNELLLSDGSSLYSWKPGSEKWETLIDGKDVTIRGSAAIWTGKTIFVVLQTVDAVKVYELDQAKELTQIDNDDAPSELKKSLTIQSHLYWVEDKLLIWIQDVGAFFDPLDKTWEVISQEGAPKDTYDTSAAFSGKKIMVFGGNLQEEHVGSIYNLESKTWTEYSRNGVQTSGGKSSTVWGDGKFIVFGTGNLFKHNTATVDLYDVESDSWTPGLSDDVPDRRTFQTSIWTGSALFIWGGKDYTTNGMMNSGGLFTP